MTTSSPIIEEKPLPYEEALAAVRPELDALDDADLIPINTNIDKNVTAVLGCLPAIRLQRAAIVKELPEYDIARFDRLEAYALAASHAQAAWVLATTPAGEIAEMGAELTKIRSMLLADVEALAERKVLDGGKLKDLKGAVGYQNIASDVLALVVVLRANWKAVSGKTAVQLSELAHAERLVEALNRAVGVRDHTPEAVTATTRLRHRAYTAFVSAYEHVRRGVAYLRWNDGDLETIAPSLYGGRNRKSANENVDDTIPVTPPAAAPVASPVSGSAVSTGMPGESPFING